MHWVHCTHFWAFFHLSSMRISNPSQGHLLSSLFKIFQKLGPSAAGPNSARRWALWSEVEEVLYQNKPYQTKPNQRLVTKPQLKVPMRYCRKLYCNNVKRKSQPLMIKITRVKPRGDIISKVSLSKIDILTLGLKRILSNKSEPLLLQLSLQRKELRHETKIGLHLRRKYWTSVYNRCKHEFYNKKMEQPDQPHHCIHISTMSKPGVWVAVLWRREPTSNAWGSSRRRSTPSRFCSTPPGSWSPGQACCGPESLFKWTCTMLIWARNVVAQRVCPRFLNGLVQCWYGACPAKNVILDGCSTVVLECSGHMRHEVRLYTYRGPCGVTNEA